MSRIIKTAATLGLKPLRFVVSVRRQFHEVILNTSRYGRNVVAIHPSANALAAMQIAALKQVASQNKSGCLSRE